jgi:dTDP-4-dehydrorhamnose reductase
MTNNHSKILLTGGSGLLGSVLRRLDPTIVAPGLDALEMTDPASLRATIEHHAPAIILHAAAVTQIAAVRKAPAEALRVNIAGTAELAALAAEHGIRLVYVSSDYVYADTPGPHREEEPLLPLNEYSWTKLGGECAVRLVPGSLIIRTSFGPPVYPYEVAAEDKLTSKLYVEEAARSILDLARSGLVGIVNLGGEPTDMLEYARRTRPGTRAVRIADLPGPIPRDSVLDLTRLKKFLRDHQSGRE